MTRVNAIALALLLVLATGVFLLSGDRVTRFRETALGWASPLLKTRDAVTTAVDAAVTPKPTYEELEESHGSLLREVLELRTENRILDDLYRQNTELRGALNLSKLPNLELVAAEIISRDTGTWYNTLVIDKGQAHGLEPNAPVIVETKLVGKISIAGPDTSVVLLVTDEGCKVAARVMSTPYLGISEGQGSQAPAVFTGQGEVQGSRGGLSPRLRLRYLDKFANIQPGMSVYTSGQGRVYPPNLELGTISSVRAGDLTTEAEITPAVDLNRLEFVFVIRTTSPGLDPDAEAGSPVANRESKDPS